MEKKAHFKFIIPGFKNLDANTQAAIRNGVSKAKLFIFTNMNEEWNEELESYIRTSANECEVQWPNEEDPNTYYYIRINDDQSLRHENKYIFDDIIPCNLTVCNTKLYLQSKSSLDESDRVAICDVIVKTIINGKVNVSSNLGISPVTDDSYGGYSKCNAYGVTLNQPGINVDADFVLEDEMMQVDANELAKNGYLSFNSYVYDSDDFSYYKFETLGAPDEMYIKYWNTLESEYQDIVSEIIKKGKGELSPSVGVTSLSYSVYKKIPNNKYTFNVNTNHIVITDDDLLNEINSYNDHRDVNYIYNAEDNPRLKKVTGKLSFKQSSVQIPSRNYIESLDIRNTYVFVTTDSSTHNNNYEYSWDYIYDTYGLKTYIDNEPVVIAAVKSYNEDKSIYVSGDQVVSDKVNRYDIVNENGDLDNGEDDIVTAYVVNEEIEYEEDPTVITLYLPLNTDGSSSYASLPMQSSVTCNSKPSFSYMYTLYTDPERTHIFQIDPSLNYYLANVSNYGVATKIESDNYSYRAHIEDMPDTVPLNAYGHTVNLYDLRSNSKLLLGICAPGYNWKTGTKVFNFITEHKESYTPNENVSETTLYFSSTAVAQPNVTSLYTSGVNTNYVTSVYTSPSLVKGFAKHDYYSYDYEIGYYNESNEWVKLPSSLAELPDSTSDNATFAYILLDFGDIWLCSNSTNEISPPINSIVLRARKKAQPHYALYISSGGLLYKSYTLDSGKWTSLITYPGKTNMPDVSWDCSDESLPQINIVKILNSMGAEVNFDASIKNTDSNCIAITNNGDQRSPSFRTVIFTLSKQSYIGCTAVNSESGGYSNNIYNKYLYPGNVYELVNIDYGDMVYEEGATYRVLGMFKEARGCIGEPLITDLNDMQYFSMCNVNGKIALSVSSDFTKSYLPYVSYVWFYKE